MACVCTEWPLEGDASSAQTQLSFVFFFSSQVILFLRGCLLIRLEPHPAVLAVKPETQRIKKNILIMIVIYDIFNPQFWITLHISEP